MLVYGGCVYDCQTEYILMSFYSLVGLINWTYSDPTSNSQLYGCHNYWTLPMLVFWDQP
jgi:hypothetical protein